MSEAQLTAFSGGLLVALWRATWQGGLAIGTLYALCRLLEARYPPSANLRCWLWRMGYLKLLLGLTTVTGVALAVLPTPTRLPSAPVHALVAGAMNAPEVNPLPATVIPIAYPVRAVEEVRYGAASGVLHSYPVWVAALYLLGVAICLIRVAQAGLRTRRVLREATMCTDDALNAEVKRLARLLHLRRTPPLALSTRVRGPCCAAGTILLPADIEGAATLTLYAPEERQLIMAHELAHIRRHDLLWEWLGTLTQVVFFFHPLVYLTRREERLSRESAADADALRVTRSLASDYAALLVGVSHQIARPQNRLFARPTASDESALAGVVGVLERGVLLRRRLLYLKENNMISPASRRRLTLVALLVLLASAAALLPWRMTATAKAVPPRAQSFVQPLAQTTPPVLTLHRGNLPISSHDLFEVNAGFGGKTGATVRWLAYAKIVSGSADASHERWSTEQTYAAGDVNLFMNGANAFETEPPTLRYFWRFARGAADADHLRFVLEAVSLPATDNALSQKTPAILGIKHSFMGVTQPMGPNNEEVGNFVGLDLVTPAELAAAARRPGAHYQRMSLTLNAEDDSKFFDKGGK